MNLSKRQINNLVDGCINNRRVAQEALYRLFHSDMLRVCYSYLADKELAKEAFNTGFLKVFQSIKQFDKNKGELGGWIRKIMIYTAIDLCRKELKFNHSANLEEEEVFLSPSILDKLYFEDILSNIRLLPLSTQTVFMLSVVDGFTHKEIGEQLNISAGTSRWHLAEARKKLRTLLESSGYDTGRLEERSDKAE